MPGGQTRESSSDVQDRSYPCRRAHSDRSVRSLWHSNARHPWSPVSSCHCWVNFDRVEDMSRRRVAEWPLLLAVVYSVRFRRCNCGIVVVSLDSLPAVLDDDDDDDHRWLRRVFAFDMMCSAVLNLTCWRTFYKRFNSSMWRKQKRNLFSMLMEAVVKQRKRSFLPKINVRRISKHQPLLFFYSSLHWHFLSTREIFLSLSLFALTCCALLQVTSRPHFSPPSAWKPNISNISLLKSVATKHTDARVALLRGWGRENSSSNVFSRRYSDIYSLRKGIEQRWHVLFIIGCWAKKNRIETHQSATPSCCHEIETVKRPERKIQ